MKKQIRRGVFETNSSSMHSLVIGTTPVDMQKFKGTSIYFGSGEYGWEIEVLPTMQDRCAYLWTAMVNTSSLDVEQFECRWQQLKDLLDSFDIEATFQEVYEDKYGYVFNPDVFAYIDHSYDLSDFLTMIFNDQQLLLNFIFSDESFIITGNDNDYSKYKARVESELEARDYAYDIFEKGN